MLWDCNPSTVKSVLFLCDLWDTHFQRVLFPLLCIFVFILITGKNMSIYLFINIAVAENTIYVFVLLVVFKMCLNVKQYIHCHFTDDRGKLALFLQMYQLDIPKLDLSVMQTGDMKNTFLEERKGNCFFPSSSRLWVSSTYSYPKIWHCFYYNHSYAFASIFFFTLCIQFQMM